MIVPIDDPVGSKPTGELFGTSLRRHKPGLAAGQTCSWTIKAQIRTPTVLALTPFIETLICKITPKF